MMDDPKQEAELRLRTFLGPTQLLLKRYGSGIDGVVYSTTRGTAVKTYQTQRRFAKELAAYSRLAERGAKQVVGHKIPRLIAASRELWVIEMSVVGPPYVVDFVATTIDHPPGFNEDAMQGWYDSLPEVFGDNWQTVSAIYYRLKKDYGIYHNDLSPNNVVFADQPREGEMIDDFG